MIKNATRAMAMIPPSISVVIAFGGFHISARNENLLSESFMSGFAV